LWRVGVVSVAETEERAFVQLTNLRVFVEAVGDRRNAL
jgi:hypothetical protein